MVIYETRIQWKKKHSFLYTIQPLCILHKCHAHSLGLNMVHEVAMTMWWTKNTHTHTISYVVTKWPNFICVKKKHLNFSHIYIYSRNYELRWNLNARNNVYCVLRLLNDEFWNFHGKFVTIIQVENGVETPFFEI